MRRFPAPWTVEALDGGFKIVDSNGQSLAYVYGHADQRDAQVAKALTLDEARRIASNIAKLARLVSRSDLGAKGFASTLLMGSQLSNPAVRVESEENVNE